MISGFKIKKKKKKKKVLSDRGKEAVRKEIYTNCLQKEAIAFQPTVKVLKIKADL